MATYKYYTSDLLTGIVSGELLLYGVYMDRILNGAGNFTGTFVLDAGDYDDIMLASSIPGQQALTVEREGVNIWTGPIWSRTYQSNSRTVQLTAQTYESIFEHVVLTSDFIKGSVEQVTILSDLLAAVQAQTNNNFGLTGSFPSATGVTRTIQLLAAEYHFASEVLQQILGVPNGLDLTIPGKSFKVTPVGTLVSSGVIYDYPGQISNYWFTESGSRGAVRSAALGAGITANATLSGSGSRPYFWQVEQDSDIVDANLLAQRANALLEMPFVSPVFELVSSDEFTSWDLLGQTFTVNIGSGNPRFPLGKTITSRMMGWSLTPESSDSEESMKLVLETDS